MNTLIKWPGGKSREIKYIEKLIPEYERYIEPFVGGGAMFFYLRPKSAIINDVSADLIDFYSLVKEQSPELRRYLNSYSELFESVIEACEELYDEMHGIYYDLRNGICNYAQLVRFIDKVFNHINTQPVETLIPDTEAYKKQLYSGILDKMQRTVKNEIKAPFSPEDMKENLITGFISGTYMYFRDVYNDIMLERNTTASKEYRVANFYFVREYCYGSMYRYNSKGEFNIPYGGMSYNRKDLKAKINDIFFGRH